MSMPTAAAFVLALMMGAQSTPVPQPFPRPGGAPAQAPPARPAPQPPPATAPAARPPAPARPSGDTRPSADAAPTEALLGVPIYPGAQFLTSYDAGRDQRYYLFGSAGSFGEVVAFYRAALKLRGELVYDVPATHEFDVGRFDDKTMAFPPGVTVKDFQSDISPGFPNPKPGGQPPRFPTIIQIVPVAGKP